MLLHLCGHVALPALLVSAGLYSSAWIRTSWYTPTADIKKIDSRLL